MELKGLSLMGQSFERSLLNLDRVVNEKDGSHRNASLNANSHLFSSVTGLVMMNMLCLFLTYYRFFRMLNLIFERSQRDASHCHLLLQSLGSRETGTGTIMHNTQPDVNTAQSPLSSRDILTAARGSGITLVGTLLEYASRFVLFILLARLMGAADYGLYNLAGSATYILMGIAMLGLDTAIVYFLPPIVSQRDEKSLWGTIQIGLGLPLLTGLLGGIGLFALAGPLAENVFHKPELAPLLRIVAFAIPCGALSTAAAAVTQGFKLMHYKVIAQDIVLPLTRLSLVILLALTGLTVTKAIVAYSLAMVISCALLIYFVSKLVYPGRPLGEGLSNFRRIVRYALPVYLTRLLGIFRPYLSTLLLGALSTVTSVGIFVAAAQVSMVGIAFLNSVNAASMPIVSELYANKNRDQLEHFYQTVTKWTLSFYLPVFLLILNFSRPILSIFGESFEAGAIVLIIVAGGNLFNAATGMCGVMITMTGNTWLDTANSFVSLMLVLTFSALLIPGMGMTGAAIAAASGVVVINVIQTLEVLVLFRFLPYNRTFIKPIVAGAISAAAAYLLAHGLFKGDSFVGIVSSAIILLVTYVGVILLLGLSPEDRLVLKRLSERLERLPILSKLVK